MASDEQLLRIELSDLKLIQLEITLSIFKTWTTSKFKAMLPNNLKQIGNQSQQLQQEK